MEDELVDLEELRAIPSNMSGATEIYHETFRQDNRSRVDIWSHEVQNTKMEGCWRDLALCSWKINQAFHPPIKLLRTVFWDVTRCWLVISYWYSGINCCHLLQGSLKTQQWKRRQ